jgi:hypothetical protein
VSYVKVRSTDAWIKKSKKEFSETRWYTNRQRSQGCADCGGPTVWGWCQICTPTALPAPSKLPMTFMSVTQIRNLPWINGRIHVSKRPVGQPRRNYRDWWLEDERGLTSAERRTKRKREYKRAKDAAIRDTKEYKDRRKTESAQYRAKHREEINRRKREARARKKLSSGKPV